MIAVVRGFPLAVSVVLTRETSLPVGAELFQKGEELQLLLFTQSGKRIGSGLECLGALDSAKLRQPDVRCAAIRCVLLALNQTGALQLADDLAGRTGLNTQLLGQSTLGHAAFLGENV